MSKSIWPGVGLAALSVAGFWYVSKKTRRTAAAGGGVADDEVDEADDTAEDDEPEDLWPATAGTVVETGRHRGMDYRLVKNAGSSTWYGEALVWDASRLAYDLRRTESVIAPDLARTRIREDIDYALGAAE
jgi:hypothetical protein